MYYLFLLLLFKFTALSGFENYTISKVKSSFFVLNKSAYVQSYPLSVGQKYTQKEHEKALAKFKESFEKKGYKNADCWATFKPSDAYKSVAITLHCNKNERFVIKGVTLKSQLQDVQILLKQLHVTLEKQLIDQKYDASLIEQSLETIKKLFKKNGYTHPTIEIKELLDAKLHTVNVTFVIDPQKSHTLLFSGNHSFSQSELQNLIYKFDTSMKLLPAILLEQEVKNYYQARGFFNVKVEVFDTENQTLFVVDEAKRAIVNQVTIKDVFFVTEKKIAEMFFTKKIKNNYYNADNIKDAQNEVVSWYKKHGFADCACFEKKEIDTGTCHITISVDEGFQYFIKSVTFSCDPTTLQSAMPPVGNQNYFSTAVLAQQKEIILKTLKKRGYPLVTCKPNITYQEDKNDKKKKWACIDWQIEKGPQVYIGNSVLKGTTTVSKKTVDTIIGLDYNLLYTNQNLQLFAARLKQLNTFSVIRLKPFLAKSNQVRDLEIELHDDDPYEVKFRFGFAQMSKNFALKKGSTYKCGSTFLIKNISNNADTLKCDVDFTRFERKCDLMYQRPILLVKPWLFSLKGYNNKYTQPLAAGSKKVLYKAKQEGFLTTLTSQNTHWTTGITTGFEWMKITNISNNLANIINFKTDLINKKVPYFFAEPSIFIDLLDDKINPKKGLFIAASAKGMFPLINTSYLVKLLVEQGIFFPFFNLNSVVCAVRIKGGHIFKTEFNKIMPTERFYLGGANSLRGYLPDACPPLATFTESDGTIQQVPQGGKSLFALNFEIRIPVIEKIDFVLFQDFGVLAKDIRLIDYQKEGLASSGFGIRYNTSIGPLRFDIGWKWHKPFKQDTPYAWHLTFGHAF